LKNWVAFSLALTCVILLTVTDTLITVYAVTSGLGVELNPVFGLSSDLFFFSKGLGVGLISIIAYELRSRDPVMAFKGLVYCTIVLSAIVVWNLVNILLSLRAQGALP